MTRDLTTSTQTALQQRVVRPVLIGRLDIDSDPVFAWTGPGLFAPTGTGDAALDDQTYDPAEAFIDISEITEDQGIGGPVTIVAAGNDLNQDLLRQVVRDKRAWRGKPAYLWMGLLDADEKTVIANPFRVKSGIIASMSVTRSPSTASVSVTIDEDLGRARSAPFRLQDHRRLYADDTATAFMAKLANKPKGLESFDVRPPTNFGGYPFSFGGFRF